MGPGNQGETDENSMSQAERCQPFPWQSEERQAITRAKLHLWLPLFKQNNNLDHPHIVLKEKIRSKCLFVVFWIHLVCRCVSTPSEIHLQLRSSFWSHRNTLPWSTSWCFFFFFFLSSRALNRNQARTKVEDLIDDSLWLPGFLVRPLSAATVESLFHK